MVTPRESKPAFEDGWGVDKLIISSRCRKQGLKWVVGSGGWFPNLLASSNIPIPIGFHSGSKMKGALELYPRKSETDSDLLRRGLLAFQTFSKAQSGMWTGTKVSGASERRKPYSWTSAAPVDDSCRFVCVCVCWCARVHVCVSKPLNNYQFYRTSFVSSGSI